MNVVPFVDLRRQATTLAAELEVGFADVLDRGRFVGGPALERFETEFGDAKAGQVADPVRAA